jgi:hypothetical protein
MAAVALWVVPRKNSLNERPLNNFACLRAAGPLSANTGHSESELSGSYWPETRTSGFRPRGILQTCRCSQKSRLTTAPGKA